MSRLPHKFQRFKDFSYNKIILDNKKVSKIIFSFILTQFFSKKSLSKLVLCQSIGRSQIKFSIFCINLSSKTGASLTSESKIFVIFEIISGIGIRGLIKVEKTSVISKVFSSNLTKAISIILSLFLSTQVVSKSIATIIFNYTYFK
jgi:hypothetical protein